MPDTQTVSLSLSFFLRTLKHNLSLSLFHILTEFAKFWQPLTLTNTHALFLPSLLVDVSVLHCMLLLISTNPSLLLSASYTIVCIHTHTHTTTPPLLETVFAKKTERKGEILQYTVSHKSKGRIVFQFHRRSLNKLTSIKLKKVLLCFHSSILLN